MRKFLLLFILIVTLVSCNEDVLPKPVGYLSLTYPSNSYKNLTLNRPYDFEMSEFAVINDQRKNWLKIQYPKLKASIHITYRPIQNNLKEILTESEKLVYEHAVKAEEIITKNFENFDKRVFGSMQEISGNAASQIQFHLTDSTHNFIKGTLYFYTKPNYDSILPAVEYVKKDIIRIVETLTWK
jgi:gliding motility-associated lipoprotein GldD